VDRGALTIDGLKVGSTTVDGEYFLTSQAPGQIYEYGFQETQGNYFGDIHADVKLEKNGETVVNLHDADPQRKLDNNIHPEVQSRVTSTIQDMRSQGFDIQVASAYRTFAQQAALPASSRPAPPGASYHNYGLAIDFAFADENGVLVGGDDGVSYLTYGEWAPRWEVLAETAEANGLVSGFRFRDKAGNPNPDHGHVEFHPGLSTASSDALRLADAERAGGLEAAWEELARIEQQTVIARGEQLDAEFPDDVVV